MCSWPRALIYSLCPLNEVSDGRDKGNNSCLPVHHLGMYGILSRFSGPHPPFVDIAHSVNHDINQSVKLIHRRWVCNKSTDSHAEHVMTD